MGVVCVGDLSALCVTLSNISHKRAPRIIVRFTDASRCRRIEDACRFIHNSARAAKAKWNTSCPTQQCCVMAFHGQGGLCWLLS